MKYTVIGLYVDNGQRYATCVEAENPAAAEKEANRVCGRDNGWETDEEVLQVAGVVEGEVKLVDTDPYQG